jgi:hypothetical protein
MDLTWVIVLLVLYCVPTFIALARRTQMVVLICVLNVILGWTIVGWSVSLALAMLLPGDRARRALPPAGERALPSPAPTAAVAMAVESSGPPGEIDFLLSPIRVAGLSILAPLVYEYWWFWRFFQFAKHEALPRARSFWWIFVPFYGWAIIGRLFHDLEARLGPNRPADFNPQIALAIVVAGDVSMGYAFRLAIPLSLISFGIGVVFIAVAIYQVQTAANAYLRATYPGGYGPGMIPAELIAAAAGLLLVGTLVLDAAPSVQRFSANVSQALATVPPSNNDVIQPSAAPTSPMSPPTTPPGLPTTPTPTPIGDYLLKLASEAGDYIGQGRSATMTRPGWRLLPNVSDTSDTVTVSFETVDTANFTRWTVWLAAPRGQVLHPGTYVNATRAAFRADSSPGIDVSGDGRGCNNVYGSFTVTKVTIDQQGKVQSFEATFEQHCEQPTAPALRGYVRFGIAASDQQARLETRWLG